MTIDRVLAIATVVLATTLVVFKVRGSPHTEPRSSEEWEALAQDPLLPGDVLRSSLRSLEGDSPHTGEGCWHAIVASTLCPWCRRLASEWYSGPAKLRAIWIFAEARQEVSQFVTQYRLSADSVFLADDVADLPEFGVFATPTRLTVVGDTISDLSVLQELPTAEEGVIQCESSP